MARPRTQENQGLPKNLIYDKVHGKYRYRRPDNKQYHFVGDNRRQAVRVARELNAKLTPQDNLVAEVLVGRARQPKAETVPVTPLSRNLLLQQYIESEFIPHALPERHLSARTLEDYQRKLTVINKELGHYPLTALQVVDLNTFLKSFPNIHANRYRSLLVLIFKYAVANGLCQRNIARDTLTRRERKQRKRLTLLQYQAIHELAPKWLRHAMTLSLLTLQRQSDVANMRFEDIRAGYLYVIQQKTHQHSAAAYIKIKVGAELRRLVKRCQDNICSPYLVHRLPVRKVLSAERTHFTQVLPDFISKGFAKAREQTALFADYSAAQKPSFHEIRSLGIKLYEDQGHNAQALAGHSNRKMTEHYIKGHDIQWVEARADLPLKQLVGK